MEVALFHSSIDGCHCCETCPPPWVAEDARAKIRNSKKKIPNEKQNPRMKREAKYDVGASACGGLVTTSY